MDLKYLLIPFCASGHTAEERPTGVARGDLPVGGGQLVQTMVGGWMLLSPRSFYDEVPWVAMLPPYNQHLMTGLGGSNLAVALVFGVAAVSLDRLLVRTVLVGYLLYAVPHLIFHSTHLAGFGAFAGTVQTTLQAIVALLPLGLLALTRTTRRFPGERYTGVARKG